MSCKALCYIPLGNIELLRTRKVSTRVLLLLSLDIPHTHCRKYCISTVETEHCQNMLLRYRKDVSSSKAATSLPQRRIIVWQESYTKTL